MVGEAFNFVSGPHSYLHQSPAGPAVMKDSNGVTVSSIILALPVALAG